MNSGKNDILNFFSSDYFGHYGWSGILRGAGVVFFAFIGFDGINCCTG
jgi:APA family basic amino acid/polyamine antiporter